MDPQVIQYLGKVNRALGKMQNYLERNGEDQTFQLVFNTTQYSKTKDRRDSLHFTWTFGL